MKTLAPFFILLLAAALAAEEPRKVRIIASPETTYFTEPQLPDGRIDYRTILNNRCAEGVTPEENVVVALFSWLAEYGEAITYLDSISGIERTGIRARGSGYREEVWRELGFDSPPDITTMQYGLFPFEPPQKKFNPEERQFFPPEVIERHRQAFIQRSLNVWPEDYVATLLKHNEDGFYRAAVLEQDEKARRSLWTERDFPYLAEGIKKTDEQTKKLIENTRRTQYYHPIITYSPFGAKETAESLGHTPLPYAQSMRSSVARFLQLRGNWDFANGNIDQAFECAFSSVRLGNTIRGGAGFHVEDLVGIVISGIGKHQLVMYLANIDGKKNADWILQKKKVFETQPQVPPDNSLKLVFSERLTTLSIVQELIVRHYFLDATDLFDNRQDNDRYREMFGGWEDWSKEVNYDWNVILRRCNLFYDDYEEIILIPDYARRLRALERLEKHVREFRERYETEQDGTRRTGDLILSTLTPATVATELARGRAEWLRQCTLVAFALAAYRSEHEGKNPDTLEQLVPKYLEAVPTSPFTGEALPYINREDVCFVASTDRYKFDGSDEEVERVLAETASGSMGVIYPEAYSWYFISQHFILVIQK